MKKIIITVFLLTVAFVWGQDESVLHNEIPSIWPIKGGHGTINLFYGENINPIHGMPFFHYGIDIAVFNRDDPIIATADGEVVTAEYAYDWGNYVVIRHKHGFSTRYAHMASYTVTVGQLVQQGEVIWYIGSTGISIGPHLHYGVYISDVAVDPCNYINDKEINY